MTSPSGPRRLPRRRIVWLLYAPRSEMATAEIADWKQSLGSLLPSGDGAVARAGNVVTVTVQWVDGRGAVDAVPKQFAMSTEL